MDKEFKKKHINLKPQIEIAAHELLIRFASIHLGVSCVVKEFSKDSLEAGSVYEMNLNPPLPHRNIGFAYLKHNPLSKPAEAFLKLIREK